MNTANEFTVSDFTFQYVSINTNSANAARYASQTLHSNMFLLIRSGS